jgi:hypothetical protein
LPPSSVTSGLGFNFGWIAGATWNIEVSAKSAHPG